MGFIWLHFRSLTCNIDLSFFPFAGVYEFSHPCSISLNLTLMADADKGQILVLAPGWKSLRCLSTSTPTKKQRQMLAAAWRPSLHCLQKLKGDFLPFICIFIFCSNIYSAPGRTLVKPADVRSLADGQKGFFHTWLRLEQMHLPSWRKNEN